MYVSLELEEKELKFQDLIREQCEASARSRGSSAPLWAPKVRPAPQAWALCRGCWHKQGDKALRESGLAFLFPAWTRIFSLLLLGNQCCNHLFQTESVSREGMHFPTQKENACLHPICPVSAEVIHYTLCRVFRGKTFYPHNFLHSKSSSQWVLIFTSWKLGFYERKQ